MPNQLPAKEFNAAMVGEFKKIETADSTEQDILKKKNDKWFAPDKAKHFLAGTFSTVFVYKFCKNSRDMKKMKSKTYAVSISALISVGKEILDSRSSENHFCKKDLLYDGLGILAGLVIINLK
ncbi:MAG: hypothetical protein KAR38_05350 [Calditrichia bacterium]|nr:hypothetical protein [Calditrichia bacterium]